MAHDSRTGNTAFRKRRWAEKIEQGRCIYLSCDKEIDREELCNNHYLELIANINASDARGLATFCRRGVLNMREIARKHGYLKTDMF